VFFHFTFYGLKLEESIIYEPVNCHNIQKLDYNCILRIPKHKREYCLYGLNERLSPIVANTPQ
jgi:hypothetical protein